MTDRAADKPSNAAERGKTAAEEFNEMFPDENEHTRTSGRPSQQTNEHIRTSGRPSQQTKPPEVESQPQNDPYADIDNLGRFLDESQSEEEMLSMSSYGGERYSRSGTEPTRSDTPTYDLSADSDVDMTPMQDMLDIDSMEVSGKEKPKDEPEYLDIFDTSDEESSHGVDVQQGAGRPSGDVAGSGKRIQLTEDDYADRFFPGRDEESSESKEVEQPVGEVEAEPTASPLVEEPVAAPSSLGAIKSRANIGVLLGLIGVIGSAAAIWFGFGTSDRVDHLETQRVAHSPAVAMRAQTAAIASLNHRVDKLSGQFDTHLKQFAQLQKESALEAQAQNKLAAEVAKQAEAKPMPPATTKPKPVAKPVAVKHAAPSTAKHSSSAKPVVAALASKSQEWVVNLSSFRKPAVAARELARIKKLGIQADSIKVVVHGRTWVRLRALGYPSEKAAREHLKAVEKQAGIHDAWVGVR